MSLIDIPTDHELASSSASSTNGHAHEGVLLDPGNPAPREGGSRVFDVLDLGGGAVGRGGEEGREEEEDKV